MRKLFRKLRRKGESYKLKSHSGEVFHPPLEHSRSFVYHSRKVSILSRHLDCKKNCSKPWKLSWESHWYLFENFEFTWEERKKKLFLPRLQMRYGLVSRNFCFRVVQQENMIIKWVSIMAPGEEGGADCAEFTWLQVTRAIYSCIQIE